MMDEEALTELAKLRKTIEVIKKEMKNIQDHIARSDKDQ